MSNSYFNHVANRVPAGSLARADQVNNIADEIASGFDLVPDLTGVASGAFNFAVATGTANAIALAMPTAPTSYTDGLTVKFRATAQNTSAVTLNIDGLGPLEIRTPANAALTAGAIRVGGIYEVTYSSVAMKFILTSQSNVAEQALVALSGDIVGTTDTQTLTNKTLAAGNNTIQVSAAGVTATELEAALEELAAGGSLTTHEADTSTHGVTGNIVGTTGAQTLSGKTINTNANTIGVSASGIAASELDAALEELKASIEALVSGTIGSIGDISDVVVTGVVDNDILAYNSGTGKWINQNAAEAGVAAASHNHSGVYEPVFTKNTAFNKNFGTASGTVSQGNHTHAGVYEPAFAKNSGFNLNVGTSSGTVAAGNHAHSGVYEQVLGNPGVNGQVLASTTAGARSWVALPSGYLTDLVNDTTPQLGGNLDMNGFDISNSFDVGAAMRLSSANSAASEPDLLFYSAGVIAAESNLYVNIDSDNSGAGSLMFGKGAGTSAAALLLEIDISGYIRAGSGYTPSNSQDLTTKSFVEANFQPLDADIPTVAASQAEMEAGTSTALRSMTPQRVAQAIAALAAAGGNVVSTDLTPSQVSTSSYVSCHTAQITIAEGSKVLILANGGARAGASVSTGVNPQVRIFDNSAGSSVNNTPSSGVNYATVAGEINYFPVAGLSGAKSAGTYTFRLDVKGTLASNSLYWDHAQITLIEVPA